MIFVKDSSELVHVCANRVNNDVKILDALRLKSARIIGRRPLGPEIFYEPGVQRLGL